MARTLEASPVKNESGRDGRILGRLRTANGIGIVRIEACLDTDIDDLWSALTETDRLARWLGKVKEELRIGGEFRATFDGSGWHGTGRVQTCEPPRRLQVETKDADEPNESVIEVTLSADGDKTSLVWEERGVLVGLLPEYGAGVQIQVEDLAEHLAGRPRSDAKAKWDVLIPGYRDLRIEAS